MVADFVHGSDGLGDAGWQLSEPKPSDMWQGSGNEKDAAAMINELSKKHPKLVLLLLGPFTNAAVAIRRYPDLASRVAVVAMGGAFTVPGNVNPSAEANVWHDPEAADAVLQAKWRIPLRLVTLDVTMEVAICSDQREVWKQHSERQRPTVGDKVKLSDAASHNEKIKAGRGSLSIINTDPPDVGEILQDEYDVQPYKVKGPRGDVFWYRENEVELAEGKGKAPEGSNNGYGSHAYAVTDFYQKFHESVGFPCFHTHDALAALAVMQESRHVWIRWEDMRVRVATEGITKGQTVGHHVNGRNYTHPTEWRGPVVEVARRVSAEAARHRIQILLTTAPIDSDKADKGQEL